MLEFEAQQVGVPKRGRSNAAFAFLPREGNCPFWQNRTTETIGATIMKKFKTAAYEKLAYHTTEFDVVLKRVNWDGSSERLPITAFIEVEPGGTEGPSILKALDQNNQEVELSPIEEAKILGEFESEHSPQMDEETRQDERYHSRF